MPPIIKIEDKLKDIIIYSEKITYFKQEDKILTEGKTKAYIDLNMILYLKMFCF